MSLIDGRKIQLHGDGSHMRHYLAAPDIAAAMVVVARKGAVHEVYNIGSREEHCNRDVARMICEQFNVSFDSSVEFVQDRPFNDRRYAISWDKINDLGWTPKRSLPRDIPGVVDWYRKHAEEFRSRLALVSE